MIRGVGHVAITVSDLEQSLRFYRDILGFPVVRSFVQSTWAGGGKVTDLSLDTRQLGEVQLLKYPEGSEQRIGVQHIAMLVDDMDSVCEHLRKNGITFVMEPTAPTPGKPRAARFYGSDNVLIELITFVTHGRSDYKAGK